MWIYVFYLSINQSINLSIYLSICIDTYSFFSLRAFPVNSKQEPRSDKHATNNEQPHNQTTTPTIYYMIRESNADGTSASVSYLFSFFFLVYSFRNFDGNYPYVQVCGLRLAGGKQEAIHSLAGCCCHGWARHEFGAPPPRPSSPRLA